MAHKFKLEAEHGQGFVVAYMGNDSDGWVKLVDSDAATSFEPYKYEGVQYYKVAGGPWDGYYLSLNDKAYLGLYSWNGASGWKLTNEHHMISEYNNQHVSYYSEDDGWVYAWDDYRLFRVTVEND